MNEFEKELNKELVVEAVLFASGNPVSLRQICHILSCDVNMARKIMDSLMARYDSADTAITIIELEGRFTMCTKPEYYKAVSSAIGSSKKLELSQSVLETLAVIAYRQPITRSDIEALRGVSCDYAVGKLFEFGLIREAGKLDKPGRPALLATTEDFLKFFGVSSKKDLPGLTEEQERTILAEIDGLSD